METGLEDLTPIEDLARGIAGLAERLAPAVVGLGRGWSLGSGVVVGDGRVLTSAHSVRGEETTVTFGAGRQAAARVVGTDPDRDVAVLATDTGDAAPIDWEPEAQRVAIGTPVVALADPGGRGLRATPGFVSAAGRPFRGLRRRRMDIGIEHTAPLPRGSSGGPLVDLRGRLLGLNTLRLEGSLVLAVAADRALWDRVDRIARGEVPRTRRLGVALAPPGVARRMRGAVGLPDRGGLLVRAVEEGTPAARAGLAPGDLLVGAGDRVVDGLEPLHAALEEVGADERLALRVVRGTEDREITVAFNAAGEGAAP